MQPSGQLGLAFYSSMDAFKEVNPVRSYGHTLVLLCLDAVEGSDTCHFCTKDSVRGGKACSNW